MWQFLQPQNNVNITKQEHILLTLAVDESKGCGNWGGLDYNHRQALLKNPLPPPPCQPSTADMLSVALSHCVTTNKTHSWNTITYRLKYCQLQWLCHNKEHQPRRYSQLHCHTVSQQTTPAEVILSHTATVSQQTTIIMDRLSQLYSQVSHSVTANNTNWGQNLSCTHCNALCHSNKNKNNKSQRQPRTYS